MFRRKNKEEALHRARVEAFEEIRRAAHKLAMKAWADTMLIQTNRTASLDEFDEESINTIHDIVTNERFYFLITENSGQVYARQHMLGRGLHEDPVLSIALYYKYVKGCHEGEARVFIDFGRPSEGLEVIKSRWDLVNRLFNSLKPPDDLKRRELQSVLDKLNAID